MSLLERIYYFHSRIRDEKYPNTTDLVDTFEISTPTANRDIAYLRDRLLAPLSFSQKKNGYYYTEDNFRLPFEESANIVLFLGLMTSIAGEMGLANLPELNQLQEKLSSLALLDNSNLEQYIHCEWIESEPVNNEVFKKVLTALLEHHQLMLSYSGTNGSISRRDIDPLKLLNYEGKWYLYAWCHLRQARRLFHLARISQADLTTEPIQHSMELDDTDLTGVFGIFKGSAKYSVTLHFYGMAAQTVARQRWHPEQQMENIEDGLKLVLPIADERELLMRVLQFGSQVKIIDPPELKKQFILELQKTLGLYNN